MNPLYPWRSGQALGACVLVVSLLTAARASAAGAELQRFTPSTDQVLDVAFLPDGQRFVCCTGFRGKFNEPVKDHAVYLWDLATGKPIYRFEGHAKEVRCLALAPDGRTLASGSLDGTVRFWNLETGREIDALRSSGKAAVALAYAPDGRHLLVGSREAEPLLYFDPAAPNDVLRLGPVTSPADGVAVTPDGKRAVTAHSDKLLRVWDLGSGKLLHELAGHNGAVACVTVTPDGRRAVSGSLDGTVRTWDIEAGTQVLQFKVRTRGVNRVVVSPDGRKVLSCCADNFLWVWGLESGAPIGKYIGHEAQLYSAAFSPDGRRALSASADKTVRLWDLTVAPSPTRPATVVAELPPPSDSAPWGIAVLDFADLGPAVELGVLRKALAEMLIGDLSRHAALRVVERGRVESFLSENQAGKSGLVDPATAQRAGAELAADYLLTGSLAGTEGKVTIKAALTRVGAPKPRGEWTVSGSAEKLFDLERDLAGQIGRTLGLTAASVDDTPIVAVLGFRDLSPKPRLKEMESGFSEILQTELAGIEGIRLVEREKLDAVLKEQKLTLSGLAAADAAVKVGKLLGANRLVFGSFLELGTDLRVEARLVDTATAAVLKAETAQGPTEQFAAMFEDLALRLSRALTTRRPARTGARAPDAAGPHKLEAARHFALGREALRLDQYPEAIAAFERALLLEPDNLDFHYHRLDALYRSNDYPRTIAAAKQALSRTFTPKQEKAKRWFTRWLLFSYLMAGPYDEHLALLNTLLAEAPDDPDVDEWQAEKVTALFMLGRYQEGTDVLNQRVAQAKTTGDPARLDRALQQMYDSLRNNIFRTGNAAGSAAALNQVLETLVKAAEAHRTREWDEWAGKFIGEIGLVYQDNNTIKYIHDTEKRIDFLKRLIARFTELPRFEFDAHFALAAVLESTGQWKEAGAAYRYVAEHAGDGPQEDVPWRWETEVHLKRDHWLNRVIRARVQAALMRNYPEGDRDATRRELKAIVDDYGWAHQQGALLALANVKFDQRVEVPPQSALIVGGGITAWKSWSRVLGPLGYTVHPYDLERLTAANLAPYALVVVVRQSDLAWQPAEVLALRSYAATGGALLAVVSPGWNIAAPAAINPLLAFLGVHARSEPLPVRVQGLVSPDHPIGRGLATRELMAKDSVALEAPADATVAAADGRSLLVAVPYHEGRVAVAALGQWLLPDVADLGTAWWLRCPELRTQSRIDSAPIETGDGAQLPLLKSVLAWLGTPPAGRAPGRRLPDDFLKVQSVALDVLYGARSRDDLAPALAAFVSAAGARREEALWVAGDADRQFQWFDDGAGDEMVHGWKNDIGPPLLDPQYFAALVQSYPRGELAPYARWECAEIDRINRAYARGLLPNGEDDIAPNAAAAIPAFAAVDAPKGTSAWAWAHLRIAFLCLKADQPERALEEARSVADALENGPEKVLALYQAAVASGLLGQLEQARRYYQIIIESPAVHFADEGEFSAWSPAWWVKKQRRFTFSNYSSRATAPVWLRSLETEGP